MAAGRGVTGTLRAAFVGAAGGQLLVGATEAFGKQHPGCEVIVREAQTARVRAFSQAAYELVQAT